MSVFKNKEKGRNPKGLPALFHPEWESRFRPLLIRSLLIANILIE